MLSIPHALQILTLPHAYKFYFSMAQNKFLNFHQEIILKLLRLVVDTNYWNHEREEASNIFRYNLQPLDKMPRAVKTAKRFISRNKT